MWLSQLAAMDSASTGDVEPIAAGRFILNSVME